MKGAPGDDLDVVMLREDAAWSSGYIAELEGHVAILACMAVTSPTRLDAVVLANAVAARVVEELRDEGLVGPPKLLADYDEAARMLGITRAALEKRVQRQQIPPGVLLRTGDHRVQFFIARLSDIKSRRGR